MSGPRRPPAAPSRARDRWPTQPTTAAADQRPGERQHAQEAEEVGDEAGRDQQQPAEQDHRAVDGGPGRRDALGRAARPGCATRPGGPRGGPATRRRRSRRPAAAPSTRRRSRAPTWMITQISTIGTATSRTSRSANHRAVSSPCARRRTGRRAALAPRAQGRRAPPGDPPQRLGHDRAAILDSAAGPLDERDRDLDDAEAGPPARQARSTWKQ